MTVSNTRPWFWVDSYAHAVYFQSAIERPWNHRPPPRISVHPASMAGASDGGTETVANSSETVANSCRDC